MPVHKDFWFELLSLLDEDDISILESWLKLSIEEKKNKPGGCPFGGKKKQFCSYCAMAFWLEIKAMNIHWVSFLTWYCPCSLFSLKAVITRVNKLCRDWKKFQKKIEWEFNNFFNN